AWTLVDTATPEVPVLASGKLTISTDAPAENMYYVQDGSNVSIPDPLIVEARVRLVSGTDSGARTAPIAIALTTAPEVGVLFFAEADRIFLADSETTEGDSAVVDTDDAPHTYQFVIDGTGAVRVFYDGVLTLTGATYQGASDHGPVPRVVWGEVSSGASGTHEWEFVRNNAAVCTTTTTTTTSSTSTSTSSTSTSTSTSSSTSSSTSTSSTTATPTTALPTTTTSTLPSGGCDGIPDGATFPSLRCRLEALRDRVNAESGLDAFQPKLAKTLEKAIGRLGDGRALCGEGNLKKTRKRIGQVAQALRQYAHRLRGLPARKKLDDALRQELLATGESITPDADALRDAVACPADGAT
ncbi:MAG: hypothetical protein ACREQL_11960, partial [Candidatus Binatia bacterium]